MGALISRFTGDADSMEQQRATNINAASAEIGNEKSNQRSPAPRQSREPQRQRDTAHKVESPETPKIYKTTLEANIEAVPPKLETKHIDATYNEPELESPESPIKKPLLSDRLLEIEEAVIKIQAGIRGYLVRKRLKELEDIQSSVSPIVPPPKKFSDAKSDSDLNLENQEEVVSKYIKLVNETNEEFQQSLRTEYYSPSDEEIEATKRKIGEEEAAVKIQSAFRGHLCRKQVVKDKEKDIFFDANDRSNLSNDVLVQNALNIANDKITDTSSELPDSRIMPNVPAVAESKCEDLIVFAEEQQSEPVTIDDTLLTPTLEDEAAVKIQAAFRGYQVRKSISREPSPIRQKTEISFIPEENKPKSPSLVDAPVFPAEERASIDVLDALEHELVQQLKIDKSPIESDNFLDTYLLDQSEPTPRCQLQFPTLDTVESKAVPKFNTNPFISEVESKPQSENAQSMKFESVAPAEMSSTMKQNIEELKPDIHFQAPKKTEKVMQVSPIIESVKTPHRKETSKPEKLGEASCIKLSDETSNSKEKTKDVKEPNLQFQIPTSPKRPRKNESGKSKPKTTETSKPHVNIESVTNVPKLESNISMLKENVEELKSQIQFQPQRSDEEIAKVTPKSERAKSLSREKIEAAVSEISSVLKESIAELKAQIEPETPTSSEEFKKLTEICKIVKSLPKPKPEAAKTFKAAEVSSDEKKGVKEITEDPLGEIQKKEFAKSLPKALEVTSKNDIIQNLQEEKFAPKKSVNIPEVSSPMMLTEELKPQFQCKTPKSDEERHKETAESTKKNEVVNTFSTKKPKAALCEASTVKECVESLKQPPSLQMERENVKEREDNKEEMNAKHKEKDKKSQPKESAKCQNRNKKEIKRDVFEIKPIASKLESTSNSEEVIVPQFTGKATVANNDDNSTNRNQKETNSRVEIVSCETLPKSMETNHSDSNTQSIEEKTSGEVLTQNIALNKEEIVKEISSSPEKKKECHESLNEAVFQNRSETVASECKKTEYTSPVEDLLKEAAVTNVAPKPDVISDIKENAKTLVDTKDTKSSQSIDVKKESKVATSTGEKEQLSFSVTEVPTVSLITDSTEDECSSPPIASGCSNLLNVGTVDDSSAIDDHSDSDSLSIPRREIRSQSPNPFGRRRRRGKKHQKQE